MRKVRQNITSNEGGGMRSSKGYIILQGGPKKGWGNLLRAP